MKTTLPTEDIKDVHGGIGDVKLKKGKAITLNE